MAQQGNTTHFYVVRTQDILALNYLTPAFPRPVSVEWINRTTDQPLRPTSISLYLRTLYKSGVSPSVARLQETTGLRVYFASEQDRNRFAAALRHACEFEKAIASERITAVFDTRDAATRAVRLLGEKGVAEEAVSLLGRANMFLDDDIEWPQGASMQSVAGTIAGGSVAGAMLGIALLTIPGIGAVVATGGLAISAYTSVASISGVIGATGGALARMLTDPDVDGIAANHLERELQHGKIFLSLEHALADISPAEIVHVLERAGGQMIDRGGNDPRYLEAA